MHTGAVCDDSNTTAPGHLAASRKKGRLWAPGRAEALCARLHAWEHARTCTDTIGHSLHTTARDGCGPQDALRRFTPSQLCTPLFPFKLLSGWALGAPRQGHANKPPCQLPQKRLSTASCGPAQGGHPLKLGMHGSTAQGMRCTRQWCMTEGMTPRHPAAVTQSSAKRPQPNMPTVMLVREIAGAPASLCKPCPSHRPASHPCLPHQRLLPCRHLGVSKKQFCSSCRDLEVSKKQFCSSCRDPVSTLPPLPAPATPHLEVSKKQFYLSKGPTSPVATLQAPAAPHLEVIEAILLVLQGAGVAPAYAVLAAPPYGSLRKHAIVATHESQPAERATESSWPAATVHSAHTHAQDGAQHSCILSRKQCALAGAGIKASVLVCKQAWAGPCVCTHTSASMCFALMPGWGIPCLRQMVHECVVRCPTGRSTSQV